LYNRLGSNKQTLFDAAASLGTDDLRFLTELQANDLRATVKVGEAGFPITKWFPGRRRREHNEDDEDDERRGLGHKDYEAYHISHVEDLPDTICEMQACDADDGRRLSRACAISISPGRTLRGGHAHARP
jgi:hypothetical protein